MKYETIAQMPCWANSDQINPHFFNWDRL
jgi:hypothetical protein